MAKLLYLLVLAAVVWGAHGGQDDDNEDVIPDRTQNNHEIKCGRHYAQYPNPEDCRTYIVCQNGRKTIQSCPRGQHYNDRTIRCDEPCAAYCNKTLSCECKWSTCGLEDVCFLPQIIGGCWRHTSRYFFNKRTGECERFSYSGCGGNENNFKSLEECQQKCKKDSEQSCPAGETWSDCNAGCQMKCEDEGEEKPCPKMCVPGCVCEEPGNVRGPDNKCIPPPLCPAKPNPTPSFRCPTMNGLFPNTDNCTTYFQCSNGKPYLMACPDGLHYSYRSQRCEQPCDANCEKSLACECKWPTCGLNDLCSLLPEVGPCRAGFQNYYFNRSTGQCETFIYGGCQPNENNFQKKEECERACTKSNPVPEHFICLRKNGRFPNPKNCISYYQCADFEPQLMSCPDGQHYSYKTQKCETPCNAHCEKSLECHCKWPTCGLDNKCFLLPETGPCRAGFRNYYFNRTTGQCDTFIYGGCQGNENNFQKKEQCERACSKNDEQNCPAGETWSDCHAGCQMKCEDEGEEKPCLRMCVPGCVCEEPGAVRGPDNKCLPPPLCPAKPEPKPKPKPIPSFRCPKKNGLFPFPDNCRLYIQCSNFQQHLMTCPDGLHYSYRSQRCERPCDANCEKSLACECKWPTCGLNDLCSLLPETGRCRAGFQNYYFNRSTGQCETFTYGGCDANENNFEKKEDCEKACPPGNEQSCPAGETWSDCNAGCQMKCEDEGVEKPCLKMCVPGCVCEEPGNVRGPDNKCIPPPLCPAKPTPPPKFRCLSWNGRFPNPEDCHSYFQCSNGKPHMMPCPSGLHYSVRSQRCEQPCDANCEKSLACECKWPTCGLNDLCFLLPKIGPCRAGFQRYYFNRSTGQCEKFIYGGCQPNENNFEKKKECEKACPIGNRSPVDEYTEQSDYEHTEQPEDEYTEQSAYEHTEQPEDEYTEYTEQQADRDTEPPVDEYSEQPVDEYTEEPSDEYTEEPTDEYPELPAEEVLDPSFECGPDGLYPHANNCRSFVKCEKKVPTLNSCPKEQHFNNKTKKCESPCKAHCDRTYACKCKWPTCGTKLLCSKPSKSGPCHGTFERFYFNKRSGSCEKFTYGGCMGNENNFHTKTACERKCKHSLDICKLPAKTGMCKGNFPRYYFNYKEGKCETFTYGGCKGNDNRFKTLAECETTCLQKQQKTEDFTCERDGLFKDPESCSSYIHCMNGQKYDMPCPTGYHFNERTKLCEEPSKAQCQQHEEDQPLAPTFCNLPSEKGSCHANIPRWYYNSLLKSCSLFSYGGCKGNANNFQLKKDCESTCKPRFPHSEEICRLPADKGSCDGSIQRYYFNHNEGKCTKFIYGGCEGNHNNFESREECEKSCLRNRAHSGEICRLPADKGSCDGSIQRYYFNHNEGKCTTFIYGGCEGNQNNFESREECEKSCLRNRAHSEEICRLPADKGSCDGSIQRYYFNHNEGKCTKFIYGGCEGNQNNFESREECEKSCLRNREVLHSEPLCTEDGVHSDFEDCGRYIRCSNGKSQIETCPRGLHFNEETGQCDSPCDSRCDMSLAMECGWPMGADQKKHPLLRCIPANDTWGNIDDCSTYFYCKSDSAETQLLHCPAGKHYSASLKRCVEPCDAYCEPSMACQCGWPNCKKNTERECERDGKFKDSDSCRRYIHCSNGQRKIQDCPEGLHFNERSGECESPCDARCDLSLALQCGWPMGADCPDYEYYELYYGLCQANCSNYNQEYNCPELIKAGCICIKGYVRERDNGKCIPKSECKNHEEPAAEKFQCPRRNGKFKYPGNDHKYFECENDIPTEKECLEHQLFDDRMEECLYRK